MENDKKLKFGLLGKEIDYSFSRGYFAEKFKRENMPHCQYDNYDCAEVEKVHQTILRDDINGLNVTIPYKEVVAPVLDELSPVAAEIGAVNTIVFTNAGKRIGHNTDAYGFEKSLFEHWNGQAEKALILGTGGASKAVEYVLKQHGIQTQFVSRKASEKSIRYEDLSPALMAEHQLIVNCTPLGTFPDVDAAPAIDYSALTPNHFLFDLIYNPEETRFLQLGKAQGAATANGQNMLVHQAEASWALWTAS